MNSIDKQFEDLMNSAALESVTESEVLVEDTDIAEEGIISKIKEKFAAHKAKKNFTMPVGEAKTAVKKYIEGTKLVVAPLDNPAYSKDIKKYIDENKYTAQQEDFFVVEATMCNTKVLLAGESKDAISMVCLFIRGNGKISKAIDNKTEFKGVGTKVRYISIYDVVNFTPAKESVTESEVLVETPEVAQESFGKAKTSQDILNNYSKRISHLKSIETCDAYLKLLKEEATKFNSSLSEMAKINKEFSSGKITKDQLKEKVKPYAELLKKQCEILKIKKFDVKITAVTSEDLKKVKEVISGMMKLVNARKEELKGSTKANESESVTVDDIDAEFNSLFIDMGLDIDNSKYEPQFGYDQNPSSINMELNSIMNGADPTYDKQFGYKQDVSETTKKIDSIKG